MKILVQRAGALGDVILTTPVIRRLRRRYPDAHIAVRTAYPDVFRGSPHVDAVNEPDEFDQTFDLDLAYERRPKMHIVRAYMQEVFGDDGSGFDLQQEMFPESFARHRTAIQQDVIVVHGAGSTWRSRVRGQAFWNEVHAGLQALGLTTISVGGTADRNGGNIDLRGKQDLWRLWHTIATARCFVGSDSGPLHVAGATGTPIVGLFTSARAAWRMPLRNNVPQAGIEPLLDCVGCLHEGPAPVTSIGCRRDDYACAEGAQALPAADVIDAVRTLLS